MKHIVFISGAGHRIHKLQPSNTPMLASTATVTRVHQLDMVEYHLVYLKDKHIL